MIVTGMIQMKKLNEMKDVRPVKIMIAVKNTRAATILRSVGYSIACAYKQIISFF